MIVNKDQNIHFLIIKVIIMDNGKVHKDKDLVSIYFKMAQNMKANGKIIKLMDKEHFGMFMVINTRDNGKEIKPMDLENTPIVTEQLMKVTGAMIYSMVME